MEIGGIREGSGAGEGLALTVKALGVTRLLGLAHMSKGDRKAPKSGKIT